ncbi:MAG: lysozyme [Cyanobacteriota bacterium]|nr:lysozyme [Cyanobacteriota bacterium]
MPIETVQFTDERWLQFWDNYKGLKHQREAVIKLGRQIRQADPCLLVEGADWTGDFSPARPSVDLEPGLALIRELEGFATSAYPDPGTGGEPWTIGYGSTRWADGRAVQKGDKITREDAEALLLQMVEREVLPALQKLPHWEIMDSGQRSALLSFAWNVGWGFYDAPGFQTISRCLRERDWGAVPGALLLYVNPGTNVEAGLRARREREGALWRSGGQPVQQAPQGRKEWVTAIKALNLSQPDASTCQAACIGMAVGDKDVMGIRRRLLAEGGKVGQPAGSPAVMAAVIRQYGQPYRYEGNACLAEVYDWLMAGEFLITHGWFTGSGHVICLDGLRLAGPGVHELDVKDPWSEFDAPAWRYSSQSRFYDGFYSERCIYAACVAGASNDDARRIYQGNAKVDHSQRGMWVHRFLVS